MTDDLLDLTALRAVPLRSAPWRWGMVPTVFRHGLDALVAGFPTTGFTLFQRTDGAKPYLMSGRPLIRRGEHDVACDDGLAPVWTRLGAELCAPGYVRALGAVCGRDLGGLVMEATFWRYDAGCWLAPHPDKPEKVVSQVFYFNPHWDPAWGGVLRILRSPAMTDVESDIPPVAGTAVVIERCARSWHAVTAVTSADAPPRQSLQVVFSHPDVAP